MPSTSAASDSVSIARHTTTNPQEKELWSRHDTYYSLLGTAFVGALSITFTSAVLLGNLQAIPVAVTKQFVKYNALWVAVPGFLLPPTCVAAVTALVIATEEELGDVVSTIAWRTEALLTVGLLGINQSKMTKNHALATLFFFLLDRNTW